MSKVFLIAEAACTWRTDAVKIKDSEWMTLCRLADEVKAAGFDALKIQYCSDANELARRRNLHDHTPYLPLEFEPKYLAEFNQLCLARNLEPMCTVYLPQDVATVTPHVTRYKVASLEARSQSLFDAYQSVPYKTLYVSTGAMTEEELFRTQILWNRTKHAIEYLHCVAAYPAPLAAMNLSILQNYDFIGLSDHTGDMDIGGLAVIAGAEVIEVHIKSIYTDKINPDYAHSLSPFGFNAYAMGVRDAEQAKGDGQKRLDSCEADLAKHRVTE